MKLLALLALALPATMTNLTTFRALECGEQKIANSQKICIEPNYIQGCSIYQDQNNCSQCNKGYQLNKGRCDYNLTYDGQNDNIPGCLEKGKNNECINCANGFRRFQKTCVLGVKNCESYNSDNTCKDCKLQYSFIMGQCKHNMHLGCKVQLQGHVCKECYPPFQLNGNQCDIQYCKTLNDYGCVACECGYYLTPNWSCEKMSDGCLRYQLGKCTNCVSHYQLKGGVCQIDGCLQYEGQTCKKCDKKYEPINHGCKFKNCFDWQDGKCLICQNGYHLQNGDCIESLKQVTICQ